MSASAETGRAIRPLPSQRAGSRACAISISSASSSRLTTLVVAVVWAFPLYWGLVTTFKPEYEVVRPGVQLWPEHFTLENYVHVLLGPRSVSGISIRSSRPARSRSSSSTMAAGAGYAISQLGFPGRRLFWWMILASFMVPIPALTRQPLHPDEPVPLGQHACRASSRRSSSRPVTVIIYKQFFDSVPKDFREAAVIDGANEFQVLLRIYLPMNWGITTALAIITFIGAWNLFLWPFVIVNTEDKMNITVGITQVHDAFGVSYGRDLAVAMLAALPVAIVYLIFQRRVTQAIMLSAGIKG